MSEVDYKIYVPPIPKPKLSDDLGIVDVPEAALAQSGAVGESSMLTGLPDSLKQGQSGFMYAQLSGTISVEDSSTGATTSEYRSALGSVYSSQDPTYADMVTLIDGSGAFNARFIIFPSSDGAPAQSTISFTVNGTTWYAYNFSSVSVSGLVDAFSGFNSSGTSPKDEDMDETINDDAPFGIDITNIYETVGTGETLSIGSSIPNVSVQGGTITPLSGYPTNVASSSNSSLTAPANGSSKFLHIYAKYVISFSGSQGSKTVSSVGDGEIKFFQSTSSNYKEGGTFNSSGSEYTHFTYIGNVVVRRRGTRRFARITQVRSGNIEGIQNYNTIGEGNSSSGLSSDKTKAGLREVILCVEGKPYSTFILTSALFEIT